MHIASEKLCRHFLISSGGEAAASLYHPIEIVAREPQS
jgi:hypothetical protein